MIRLLKVNDIPIYLCLKAERLFTMEDTSTNRPIKKSFLKSIVIVLIVALLIIAGIAVGIFVIIPTNKYNNAVDLMNRGQYEDAIAAFSEISENRDVTAEVSECYYRLGEQLEKEQSYKLAYDNYSRASGFSDGQQKAYTMAEKMFSESIAENNLAAANNWADCLDPNESKSAKTYLSALKLESNDQIFDAISAYKDLPKNYRDASSRMLSLCSTAYAEALSMEETSLLQAEELYKRFPDEFTDASARLNDLKTYLNFLGTYSLKVCVNTDTALDYRSTSKTAEFMVDGYLKNETLYLTLPVVLSDGEKSRTVSVKINGDNISVNYGTENSSSVEEDAYFIDDVWVLTQKTDITYENPNDSIGGGLLYLFTSGWNEFIGSTYYEAWAKGNANYEYALSTLGLE